MDHLSLTASIIAIIGVSGQATTAIRKIAAVKDAPNLVLALNNEITDLYLVVDAIQRAFRRSQDTALSPSVIGSSYHDSVTSSLQSTWEKVQELEEVYNRLKPIAPCASGSLKFNKVVWLREQSKVRRMLDELKIVRLKLAGTLEIMNLYATLLSKEYHLDIWEWVWSDMAIWASV